MIRLKSQREKFILHGPGVLTRVFISMREKDETRKAVVNVMKGHMPRYIVSTIKPCFNFSLIITDFSSQSYIQKFI